MLIEFQTTAANYLYLFREQLRLMPLSLTDELRDEQGRLIVVNRLVIGRDTRVRRGDPAMRSTWAETGADAPRDIVAGPMQVVQPVTVELVYLDDLVEHGDRPAPVQALPLVLVFDVTLNARDAEAILAFVPRSVEGLSSSDVLAPIGVALRAAFRPEPWPLDLVDAILGDLPVVRAGIACKPPAAGDAGSVALRIEVGEPTSDEGEWQDFLHGRYADLLETCGQGSGRPAPPGDERWALFLDKELLERPVRRILEEALVVGKALRVGSDVEVRWANSDQTPSLLARFKAIAVNACDLGPLGAQDLRLDVRMAIRLSVAEDNVLRLHLKVDHRPDDLDGGACAPATPMLRPLVVAPQSTAGLSWDAFLWRVVLRPAWRLAVVIDAADEGSRTPPSPRVVQPSPDELQRDQAVTLGGSPGLGRLDLVGCRGLATGLLLTGRQAPRPETRAALIEASHCDPVFRPPEIPCSSVAAGGASVTGPVHAAADCMVANVGEPDGAADAAKIPLQMWQYRFLDTALAQELGLETIEDAYQDGLVLMLRCEMPGPRYFDDRRPVRLLLKTNGGARVFTFGEIAPLSEAQVSDLVAAGVTRAATDCQPLIEPWWRRARRFDPPWRVVPSPARFRSAGDRRLWIMSFVGLAPLDAMAASLGEETLQLARANRRGQAVLSVLQPAEPGPPLSLTYAPAPGAPAGGDGRGRMMMTQVALTEVGRCRLAADVRGLQVVWQRGARRLCATHEDGFSFVDVSIPARPGVRDVWRGAHLRGALMDSEGVLVSGGERLSRLDARSARRGVDPREDPESPVVRTLAADGRLYVVRRRSVDVFDRTLVRQGSRPLDWPVDDAVLVGDRLIMGGPNGLIALSVGRSWKRSMTERFDIGAVESLSAAAPVAPRGSVLVRRGGRALLIDLPDDESGPRQATVLAEYEESPWFAQCVTFASYVAFVRRDEIRINAIVGRAARCHSTA